MQRARATTAVKMGSALQGLLSSAVRACAVQNTWQMAASRQIFGPMQSVKTWDSCCQKQLHTKHDTSTAAQKHMTGLDMQAAEEEQEAASQSSDEGPVPSHRPMPPATRSTSQHSRHATNLPLLKSHTQQPLGGPSLSCPKKLCPHHPASLLARRITPTGLQPALAGTEFSALCSDICICTCRPSIASFSQRASAESPHEPGAAALAPAGSAPRSSAQQQLLSAFTSGAAHAHTPSTLSEPQPGMRRPCCQTPIHLSCHLLPCSGLRVLINQALSYRQ